MRAFLAATILLSLLSASAFAVPVTIHGPKKYDASPNRETYQDSFQNTKANADGVLTVINGTGEDLTPVDCPKKPVSEMTISSHCRHDGYSWILRRWWACDTS